MKRIILIILPLILISCVFNDSDGQPRAEKMAHPDIILENAVYQLSQSNENPIMIRCSRIVFSSSENRAEADSISFYQKGNGDEIRLEGHAEKALINTEKETIELIGDAIIRDASEDMEISAGKAFFDSINQEITAEGPVVVKSGSSMFHGTDFSGDLKRKRYSFSSIEKGELEI